MTIITKKDILDELSSYLDNSPMADDLNVFHAGEGCTDAEYSELQSQYDKLVAEIKSNFNDLAS